MVQATKADIKNRQAKLDKLLKGLDEDGSISDKKLCSAMRASVRNFWLKHPTKITYLMSKTYPDMDISTRTKWLVDCEHCKKAFKQSDVECDHIVGEHSLKTLEDILPFAQSILGVSHEDLRILCIPCHATFTYAERYGMTFEEAYEEKKVIAKCNQPVAKQKKELTKHGFAAKEITNQEKRRECYRVLNNGGKL